MEESYIPVAFLLFSKGVAKVTIETHLQVMATEFQKMTGLTFNPKQVVDAAEKQWLSIKFSDYRIRRIAEKQEMYE